MAIYRFTEQITRGEPIEVAADGKVWRDFTFIDDALEAVMRVLNGPAPARSAGETGPDRSTIAPFRLLNIGGDRPTELNHVIGLIEAALGRKALRVSTPLPRGDVVMTSSDVATFAELYGRPPATGIDRGIRLFVEWYRRYHGHA